MEQAGGRRAQDLIGEKIQSAVSGLYSFEANLSVEKTNPEFEGDYTFVTFRIVKQTRKSPEATGKEIGEFLLSHDTDVASYNVIKGFLNLKMSDHFWLGVFSAMAARKNFVHRSTAPETIMVEYSSPNTNKPLHLGHLRNILLGYSVAELLKSSGHRVIRTNLVNDRGIHICKSMLGWKRFGDGETPESAGIKGDHLAGKYYVAFEKAYRKEVAGLMEQGMQEEEAEKKAPLMQEAAEMLRKWEQGDPEIIALWKKMNAWVYEGFEKTYAELGVEFDRVYYESDTYREGKKGIEKGLEKGVFYRKPNGSVAVDLTADGLDEKILLRADGTSVYITQDIGTALLRFGEYPDVRRMIYTVGNEQDYHFKALFKILEKLGYEWAKDCYHLSYGMVELPEGKMKSREGKVVDADELLDEMFRTSEETTKQLGKVGDFSESELKSLYRTIGLGALKFFILKVDPKKKMLFDPKESIDFNGNTGPFVQYTYARIQSVLSKAELPGADVTVESLQESEKELILLLDEIPAVISEAAKSYNPSLVAAQAYEIARVYNRFYHEHPILKAEVAARAFRLILSSLTALALETLITPLGISLPQRM
jgi:arginyl-tRNA synthetase